MSRRSLLALSALSFVANVASAQTSPFWRPIVLESQAVAAHGTSPYARTVNRQDYQVAPVTSITPADLPPTLSASPASQWQSVPVQSAPFLPIANGCGCAASPVYTSRPVVAPQAMSPITSFRPIAAPAPTYNIGRGIIGQPTVYVPGQPLRNFLRWLSP